MHVARASRPRLRSAPSLAVTMNRMYSPQLLDHFQNPRNTGDIPGADARAEIENPACGDILRLTARVEDGRLAEIRFKAKGCVAAIACASALTELAAGKTLNEARGVNRDDVITAVGGIPQASTHAAQLAIDTLASILCQLKA
jgi:nitrogen fixation protein NifU and related proteins